MPGIYIGIGVGIDICDVVVSSDSIPANALLNDDGTPLLNDDGSYILNEE